MLHIQPLMVCQNDVYSTLKLSCNFQNMVQLLEIYHTAQEGCIFLGNMYNDRRAVMSVMPGHALVVGKVAGKGESYLFYSQYYITYSMVLNYI